MNATPKLTLEHLEAREVPTVFGNPWQASDSLSLSFAPDGVQYSNQTWGYSNYPSRLFTELGGMTAAVWQEEVLRAVHTWTSQANLNVGLVADSGRAFGPAGFLASGPAPATFRLGTGMASLDTIATAIPNHPLSGDYAGTILLNEAEAYSRGGTSGTRDLYSIILHEFGNTLGMADDDATTGSARNGHYSVRTGLVSNDITALRALYGARLADAYEGSLGNNTLLTASSLSVVSDPAAAGKSRVLANGDITTAADADFYKFTTPAGTTSFTVRLGTAGKSLLAGRIDVYNAAGVLVGTKIGTGPLQGDTVLTLTGLAANASYKIKVSAGRADTFFTGKYQLRVGFGYDPATETKADPVQRFGADGAANDTRAAATTLTTTAGFAANKHFEWTGRIESVTDHDFYKFTAPASGGVMTITVQSEGTLSTSATVYDALGNVVASNILINWEGGMYRAQVPVTVAGMTYTVQLKVQDANWSASSGNYAATIDFAQPLASSLALTSGVATNTSQIALGIDVQESGTFRFALSATSIDLAAVNWLDIYIYDATGTLAVMWGTDGLTSTDTMAAFLKKGQYTIKVVPHYEYTSSSTIAFSLKLARLSDPIDPYAPGDPTSPPPPASPPPPPGDDTKVVIVAPPYNPWAP